MRHAPHFASTIRESRRAAEAGNLGDRARGERVDDVLGGHPAGRVAVLVVAGADLLRAPPGDLDLEVVLPCGERGLEPGLLTVGQVLLAGAQDVPDPIERVVSTSAVAGGVLLHPAPDLVDDLGAQ
jgi:hypothetical protein